MSNVKESTIGVQNIVVYSAILIVAGLFAVFALNGGKYIFDLQFNVFAVLSILGATTSAFVLFLLRKYDHRNEEIFWFALMLVALIVFGLAEALQRMSITPEAALFWAKVQAVGVGLEPIAGFMFVLSFIGVARRKLLVAPLLVAGAAFIVFFQVATQVIFKDFSANVTPYLWGYNNSVGNGFIFNALWVLLFPVLAFILLVQFRRRATSAVLQKQATVIVAAFFVLIGGASTTDLLAPAIGIALPPMHAFFASVTAVLIIYSMRKFHAFKVSPARLSDEILATMHEAVLVINKDFGIEMVNTEAEKMFGAKTSSIKGTSLTAYFTDAQINTFKDQFAKLSDKTSAIAIENLFIKRPNSAHPLYVKAVVSRVSEENGLDTGYILALADVTELKHSYDLLEYEKNNVERIVDERTAQLRAAQAKLIETDKLKTEFVILASHNLRTPVTILKGSIEMTEKAEGLDEEHRQILSNAMQAANNLGVLVEDLLTISSIEAGDKLSLKPINVAEVIEPLVQEASQQAKISGNKFTNKVSVDKNVQINGNLPRLQSAIRNILDNAMKFTDKGTVDLAVFSDKAQVKITVTDTGIGIKKDELPKLFNKFHRGTDTMTYNYEGEGIGLYLTKLVIDEHGGVVDIASTEGKGTVVTVTLPIIS